MAADVKKSRTGFSLSGLGLRGKDTENRLKPVLHWRKSRFFAGTLWNFFYGLLGQRA
jgi:hypothetical protein